MTLTRQWIQASRVLLLALLAVPAPAMPAVSPRRRAEAQAAYEEAVRLQTTLESQPEAARHKGDYKKVIRAFQQVYHLNPAYAKTPAALAAVAEAYGEMGRVFSSDNYYRNSAQAYKFLIAQYPQSHIARDALYALGEIYRVELKKPEEGRKTFQKFLEKYPKSSKAAEARQRLKEIDQPQEARRADESEPARAATENRGPEHPSEVTVVRRWVGPNYSRIVIGLDGDARFDTTRLAAPDRIVLDLSNTRLSPDLVSKMFPVEDGYLRQIRIAQFRPNITRVVLDVAKIEDYSVFTLPNPFRLIIDIHGAPSSPPKTLVAQGTPPTFAEPSQSSKPSPGLETPVPVSAAREANPKERAPEPSVASRETDAQREAETKKDSNKLGNGNGATETVSVKSPPLPLLSDDERDDHGSPLLPPISTQSGARTLTRVLGLKIGRVVIDPGHGGHDTGTIGPTGLHEKDVVLDVALRLKKLLVRNTSNSVILTRTDDSFIPLEERTAIANEQAADLFISIHANASHDRNARGVETYYLNFTSSPEALAVAARENATSQESVHELQDLIKKIAMTEKIEESQEFARLVQHQVYDSLNKAGNAPPRDRGLKKAPFVVLIGANMPSILSEISFLSNPRDERLLKRPEYRQKIAEAFYLGIARYVNTLGPTRGAERARRGSSPVQAEAREPLRANRSKF